MKTLNKKSIILTACMLFTLIAVDLQAQNEGDGDEFGGTEKNDVNDTPVDGGALLLMAGGAAWGLYKKRKK
ncbi:MAG: hypothetical protein Q8R57_07155 [Bacteroidota bacterium]|nr:hypothetical protein [Bacteroidota bacterium]